MASSGMSWQYQSKFQMPPPNTQTGFGGVTAPGGDMQDMHLKMSKKIAQLTKVIYALNTKNDEHESAMISLKEAHEEESQQIIAETTAKIQQYRLKIGNEMDLRKKIENLEQFITANEAEKRQALSEFNSFKSRVDDDKCRKETDHAMKLMELSKEVMQTKSLFEQRLQEFEEIKLQIKNDGGSEIIKIQTEHRNEIDRLNGLLSEKEKSHIQEKQALIYDHNNTTGHMTTEIEQLNIAFNKSEKEHNAKMSKAKAFFDNEMKVLRSMTHSSDDELSKKWLEREASLKMEASKTEMSLRNLICQLQSELAVSKDENEDLEKKFNDSVSELKNAEAKIIDLEKNNSSFRQECEKLSNRTQTLENDLIHLKEKISSQTEDILKKSKLIGMLEASKLTYEASIQELHKEIKKLKISLENVSSERDALHANSSNENKQMLEQIKVLQNKLEIIKDEKSSLQSQFSKEIKEMQDLHKSEMTKLTDQFDSERRTTAQNHQNLVESMKHEAQSTFDDMLHDMQERYKKETNLLMQEKNIAVGKITDEKNEVEDKLNNAQSEIHRLEVEISRHENGLGDATSRINSLKMKISEMENQLLQSNKQLRASETTCSELKTNLDENKSSHRNEIDSMLQKHRRECDQVTRELNDKWHRQLRTELGGLEKKLTSKYEEEKRKVLEELNHDKNREMEAARSGWEGQIQQLTSQLSEVKHSLEVQQRAFDKMLADERNNAATLERDLRASATEAANEYAAKVSNLEDAHRLAIAAIEHKMAQENKSLETKLMSQHREDMQAQMIAHRVALESVRNNLHREKAEDLNKKDQEAMNDMEELRSELSHQHAYEVEEMQRQHELNLNTLRIDLKNNTEKLRQQEIQHTNKVDGLEDDLKQTTKVMNELQQNVNKQNNALNKLAHEFDLKGKEVLQIRSEANFELQRREEELERKHRRDQDMMEAENLRQKQTLVNEFNRATDSLKDKISALSIALQESEEMYKQRESRPEDLRFIEQLKNLVREKELQMQKLVDDKKYYQMELVNRETNFNKVFNASPNVGVMNPLIKNNKKNKGSNQTPPSRFTSKFVSVPNLSTIESAMAAPNRLEPIRTASSSPGTNVQNGHSKPLQPTPPTYPKNVLRLNSSDGEFEMNFKPIPPPRISSKFIKIPFDDFENSLKEFDNECKNIEDSFILSGSCSMLDQLHNDTRDASRSSSNNKRKPLERSNTMPTHSRLNHFKCSPQSSDVSSEHSEDYFPECLDEFIDAAWARNQEFHKRVKLSGSSSLPNYYSKR